jgi:hypothetical protein
MDRTESLIVVWYRKTEGGERKPDPEWIAFDQEKRESGRNREQRS